MSQPVRLLTLVKSYWSTCVGRVSTICIMANSTNLQLNYLKGTQNHGLVYSQSGEDLVGYADADWSANSDDRKEAVHLRSFLRKVKIVCLRNLQRPLRSLVSHPKLNISQGHQAHRYPLPLYTKACRKRICYH